MFDRRAAHLYNGMAVTHASKLRHGGATVLRGTRYILVGFMQFESTMTPIKHYLVRAWPERHACTRTVYDTHRLAMFISFGQE